MDITLKLRIQPLSMYLFIKIQHIILIQCHNVIQFILGCENTIICLKLHFDNLLTKNGCSEG